MLSGAPVVTILTPSLNNAATVLDALDSVRAQTYAGPIEHLVMDGGSTDRTLELLRERSDVTVVSEADTNLYDALNKGIRLARGELIGLLNADDMYTPTAIAAAVDAFTRRPEAAMACAGADVTDLDSRKLLTHDGAANRSLNPQDVLFGVPVINARFFRRAFMLSMGGFDIRYNVAADREFLFRAGLAGVVAVPVPGIAYIYRHHNGSLTIGGRGAAGRIARDHLLMAEDWLLRHRDRLDPTTTRLFERLHAHSILLQILADTTTGNWAGIMNSCRQGVRMSVLWPMTAASIVLNWLWRRLASRFLNCVPAASRKRGKIND